MNRDPIGVFPFIVHLFVPTSIYTQGRGIPWGFLAIQYKWKCCFMIFIYAALQGITV